MTNLVLGAAAIALSSLAGGVDAAAVGKGEWNFGGFKRSSNASSSAWTLEQFNSLVTFGDSYTDEGRYAWFASHNGTAPPPGTTFGVATFTSTGGRIWPRYVVQYTGETLANGTFEPQLELYDYAVAGAACSDKIIPRNASWGTPYPPVLEYEIPAFEADLSADANGTDTPYFDPPLTADSAVYSIWIGTNDVGEGAFLTDNQTAGATLTDFTDCVYESLDAVYAAGGRYFVLQNLIPLQLAPEYSNTSSFDVVAGIGDPVQVAEKMEEYVTTINNVYKYQTPYEVLVSGRYAGAHFAVFDVYSLVYDIYTNPSAYLNGTLTPNVTGVETGCVGDECDSYLWYNELHPSEQTDRVIARNFVDVLAGNSSYATYWG